MKNRAQILTAIKAVSAAQKADPLCEGQQYKDAWRKMEEALYAAGVYEEALRGVKALDLDVRAHTEEPEHTFYDWAYWKAFWTPKEVLNEYHATRTFEGRRAIEKRLEDQAAKKEQEKIDERRAANQRRAAALIEDERKRKEQARLEKEQEEQHRAELIAGAVARAIEKERKQGIMDTRKVWVDFEDEYRRLYAIKKLSSGASAFYFDRDNVLEFTGWPNEIPELKPEDVSWISKPKEFKGVYFIYVNDGAGVWGGKMLRRGYLPKERSLIPADSEEAQPVQSVSTPTPAKNKPSKPKTEVTRPEAVKMLGVSLSTVKNWDKGKCPYSPTYPGRYSAPELFKWWTTVQSKNETKRMIKHKSRGKILDNMADRAREEDNKYNGRRQGNDW